MSVDIRFRTDEDVRERLKKACAEEGYSYEKMVEELLDFRENNRGRWARRDADGRRPTGASQE